MVGNSFGNNFKITTFGESHGRAIGVIVDGCPAGIEICEKYIDSILSARRPAQSSFTTQRKEDDRVEILSGIYNGMTLGTPITLVVYNVDAKSKDYDSLKDIFRPSHADYTWHKKYSHRDHRGGGRSSARESVARVAAAAIAYKIIEKYDIKIYGFMSSVYGHSIDYNKIDYANIDNNPFYSADLSVIATWEEILKKAIEEGDSVGATIDIHIKNCPIGLGDPVFEKIQANLAKGIFSIPAVRGLEFGSGFALSTMKGSQANDKMRAIAGKPIFLSNNNGGILGGITNGEDITMKIAIKPTSSIAISQETITSMMENTNISIGGRHDPCIGIRAVAVCKAMCAITIADYLL